MESLADLLEVLKLRTSKLDYRHLLSYIHHKISIYIMTSCNSCSITTELQTELNNLTLSSVPNETFRRKLVGDTTIYMILSVF